METCPKGRHQVSFFKFVFVVSGKGKLFINETSVNYREKHLFLLAPDDGQHFMFETTTQLFLIRINKTYLKDNSKHLMEKIELILGNASKVPGCVLKNSQDKNTAISIINGLLHEHQHETLYGKELIKQFIETLLTIVARNLMLEMPAKIDAKTDDRAINILQYIQSNIYEPEKLRGSVMSEKFNMSETYLGKFFKKQTNETLQQYIEGYKLKLIENRLMYSDLRIAEIANQFGFTDKSHLNRFFKKFHGISPSGFRSSREKS
jgi:AraC-like DNA-binding protein